MGSKINGNKIGLLFLIGFTLIVGLFYKYYQSKLYSNPKCTKAIVTNWHGTEGGFTVECYYEFDGKKITVNPPISYSPRINDTIIIMFSEDNPKFSKVYEDCMMRLDFGEVKKCECD